MISDLPLTELLCNWKDKLQAERQKLNQKTTKRTGYQEEKADGRGMTDVADNRKIKTKDKVKDKHLNSCLIYKWEWFIAFLNK